jgi:hypothetical protein
MRLKIKGEITPEHLANALAMAVEKLESLVPDGKFYGANLYLVPYDSEGQAFDIFDARRDSLVIVVPAQSGTTVMPALSAQAQQRRVDAREARRQRYLQEADLRRRKNAEISRKRQIKAAQKAKARIAFDALNVLTLQLLTSKPTDLIDGLNEAVRASWQILKPKEPHGPRKGEPKSVPVFSIEDGKLRLTTPAWKNPRWLLNPIGSLRQTLIAPVWTYSAWVIAVDGFLTVMENLNGSLPGEILGGYLLRPDLPSES